MTDGIANINQHAKLRFINSTVSEVRGRALLVQTRDVLIENNLFKHLTSHGVHVNTAFPNWNESASTRNVVIRNNKFINCGYGFTTYCAATGIVVETETEEHAVGVHRNLTIEDNLIIGHEKPGLYLTSIDGAVVRGNRIIGDGPPVWIEYAKNIAFENNNFEQFDIVVGPGCENGGISSFTNE